MLTRTKNDSIERLLIRLPIAIRQKFARPAKPEIVHDIYGQTEMQILHRACFEIGYAMDKDLNGNWYEFASRIGLTLSDMQTILDRMQELGYSTDCSIF